MKKTMISLATMMSLSAFAAPKSEFERGYQAGLAATQTGNAYICKALVEINGVMPRAGGLSRGQAIHSLFKACASSPITTSEAVACIEALESGKFQCTKL